MSADHGVRESLSIRQAAFIGVGAMVGAGIFALLGAAGEVVAIATTAIVLVTFALTTLVEEPATAVAFVVIVGLSILLDLGWKRTRSRSGAPTP